MTTLQQAEFDEKHLNCECCGEPVYGMIIDGKATDLTPLYLVDDLRLCLECATEDQTNPLDSLLSLLKPLVWEVVSNTRSCCCWSAFTAIGRYDVYMEGDVFGYCLGSGWIPCDSIDQGKSLCWQDYVSRVRGLFQGDK